MEMYLTHEQAGFSRNYSTIDHLLTVKVLIEKTNEYHLPTTHTFTESFVNSLSLKLFIIALEAIFKKLEWKTNGININGSYLSHLKYADDIILFSQSSTDLQEMVQEMHVASERIGLQMNINKTKIMSNTGENINIKINGERLEQVEELN